MSMIIQIRRWLMQTKVWSFVGFVSAVVGLVCYALSSSFNHLFGNWNLLKIILYTIFSFITSFMVLYANIWKSPRSDRLKAHTAEQEYLQLPGENSVDIEMDSLPRPGDEFSRMMQQLMTFTNALQQENLNLKVKNTLHLIDNCKFVMAALPSGQIQDLHEIVNLMVASGYEKECSDVYKSWRSVFLQEFLINKIFGFPEAKINAGSEYQSEQFLNSMFERWITASDVAINILFPIEQELCKRVFLGFSSAASRCFIEVCQKSMFQLLNFADTFASGSPTEWRFLKMLKMFEHLRDIIPKLQSLFPDSTLLNEAIAVKNRLGEASRDFFMEIDKFIFIVSEAMQVATPYGQLHQMTVNVMSFVTSVCKSRWKLEQILQEYPMVDNEVEPSSIFVKQIEQIIKMLPIKLIAKSKIYKDPALRHIFMLNNWLHIIAKNKIYGLESILGDDWFKYKYIKVHCMECLRFKIYIKYGNQAYKYIKYGMFEIQDLLNHLFMGKPKIE